MSGLTTSRLYTHGEPGTRHTMWNMGPNPQLDAIFSFTS